MIWFTSDEHFGHENIIRFCNRPFSSLHEMNKTIIDNHNSLVDEKDTVYHLGDFCISKNAAPFYERLNGNHIFLRGSHDKWQKHDNLFAPYNDLLELKIDSLFIVLCHYAMRTWPRSHYGSIQLFGHSHGRLDNGRNQWDVGVDVWDFKPVSLEQIKKMS